ncbi:hypothetical protein EVA_05427 [gut metagenome]|uniref:Uncharacterized protein n=1 Tax=gut metagenome TaxID=749906 RepID=J9GHE4_9ZZZZ
MSSGEGGSVKGEPYTKKIPQLKKNKKESQIVTDDCQFRQAGEQRAFFRPQKGVDWARPFYGLRPLGITLEIKLKNNSFPSSFCNFRYVSTSLSRFFPVRLSAFP